MILYYMTQQLNLFGKANENVDDNDDGGDVLILPCFAPQCQECPNRSDIDQENG